jgi:hypothetical protein
MNAPTRNRILFAGALGLVAIASLLLVRGAVRRISPERIRESVIATIQSEARESFLITGSLTLTATTTIENSRIFLPGILDFNLGTSRGRAQVPGTAYYGFDVRKFEAKNIHVNGDTIEIDVPKPQLLSVDANLNELQVWTEKGWLRTPASVDKVERTAIRRLDGALARQAAAHIASSAQPHINSAHALEKMLRPVLASMGVEKPVFKFRIGERLVLE